MLVIGNATKKFSTDHCAQDLPRPQSRSIAIQTTLLKKSCHKKHHKRQNSTDVYQPSPAVRPILDPREIRL